MSRTGKDKFTYIGHHGKHSRCMRKHPRANIPEDIMHTSMKDRRFGEYEYNWGGGMNWEYAKKYLRKNVGRGYNNNLKELYAKLREANVDEKTFDEYKINLNPDYNHALIGREKYDPAKRRGWGIKLFYVDEQGILRSNVGWREMTCVAYKTDPNNSSQNLYYSEDRKSFEKKKEYNEKNLNLPEMLRETLITRELGKVWIINDSGKSEMKDVILVRSSYDTGFKHISYKEMTSQDKEYLNRNYEPTFVVGFGQTKTYVYKPPISSVVSPNLHWMYPPSTFTYRFYAKKK